MHIALDIDDTITYAPEFFAALTHAFAEAEVTIVTVRDSAGGAAETLAACGIRYDRLILSDDPELGCHDARGFHAWKADVIHALAPDIFFEDAPEIVHRIRPPTRVFMACDDVMRGWIDRALRSV